MNLKFAHSLVLDSGLSNDKIQIQKGENIAKFSEWKKTVIQYVDAQLKANINVEKILEKVSSRWYYPKEVRKKFRLIKNSESGYNAELVNHETNIDENVN